jgi:hypothetical protein
MRRPDPIAGGRRGRLPGLPILGLVLGLLGPAMSACESAADLAPDAASERIPLAASPGDPTCETVAAHVPIAFPFEDSLIPSPLHGWSGSSSSYGQGWGQRLGSRALDYAVLEADEYSEYATRAVDSLQIFPYRPSQPLPMVVPWGQDTEAICQVWPYCDLRPGDGVRPLGDLRMPPPRPIVKPESLRPGGKRPRIELRMVHERPARTAAQVREGRREVADVVRREGQTAHGNLDRTPKLDTLAVGSGASAMASRADATVGEVRDALWTRLAESGVVENAFQSHEQMQAMGVDMTAYDPGRGARDPVSTNAFAAHNVDLAASQTAYRMHVEGRATEFVRNRDGSWTVTINREGTEKDAQTRNVEYHGGLNTPLMPEMTAAATRSGRVISSRAMQTGEARVGRHATDAQKTVIIVAGMGGGAFDAVRGVVALFPRDKFPTVEIHMIGRDPPNGLERTAGYQSFRDQLLGGADGNGPNRDPRIQISFGEFRTPIDAGGDRLTVPVTANGRVENRAADALISAIGPNRRTASPDLQKALDRIPDYTAVPIWHPVGREWLPVGIEVRTSDNKTTGLTVHGAAMFNDALLGRLQGGNATRTAFNEAIATFCTTPMGGQFAEGLATAQVLAQYHAEWKESGRRYRPGTEPR